MQLVFCRRFFGGGDGAQLRRLLFVVCCEWSKKKGIAVVEQAFLASAPLLFSGSLFGVRRDIR
jgi:hypothetical protein